MVLDTAQDLPYPSLQTVLSVCSALCSPLTCPIFLLTLSNNFLLALVPLFCVSVGVDQDMSAFHFFKLHNLSVVLAVNVLFGILKGVN